MEPRTGRPRIYPSPSLVLTLVVLIATLAVGTVAQAVTPSEEIPLASPTPEPMATAVDTPGPAPSSRCCAAIAYDAARSNVLLFGGVGSLDNFSDTWVWN